MNTTADPSAVGLLANDASRDLEALQAVISALQTCSPATRVRILESVATFFGIGSPAPRAPHRDEGNGAVSPGRQRPLFSEDTSMSPKEFMLEKNPRTDVERIACLAYYLTHYRDQPHFKTLDLSKLNTDAAQPKFSNAAQAANNAVKTGYLVPSTKGNRQLSASGEQFVLALPDRVAAKAAMDAGRRRRRPRRTMAASAVTRKRTAQSVPVS